MAGNTNELVVWQWNCASFQRHKAPLPQYIKSQAVKPHVLLLQETLCESPSLAGYRAVAGRDENKRGIATLVSKKCSFQEHRMQLGRSRVEALLVEIIPNSWLKQSVYILNVYSPPSQQRQTFHSILAKASSLARGSPLIVAGDFNAPHTVWGYTRQTTKGIALVRAADNCALELITDPRFPTRMGTSVARDTTPDLTFVKNITEVAWQNLQESLGSDHFVITISVKVKAAPPREFRVTDWDVFRKIRKEDTEEYSSLSDLFERLKKDSEQATKVVSTEVEVPRMDSHLAHLLETKLHSGTLENTETQPQTPEENSGTQ